MKYFCILLDEINTWEVCKEIVNNQRSCQGCSVQASAPTRRQKLKNKAVLNLKQYCMHSYMTFLINVHKDQGQLTAPTIEWASGPRKLSALLS